MLVSSVGIEEFPGDIHNLFTVPVHNQARLLGDYSHLYALEILAGSDHSEELLVFGRDHARHPLLGFAYSELCSVKAFVLLRHSVEIDLKTVGQLAYGDADSARSEVVASLDHACGNTVAEEPLYLALLRRVALLHLSAAGLYRVHVVRLRRACSTADSVTSGGAAEKHYNISRLRAFSSDVYRRSGCHDSADFHALRCVSRMIDLIDDARAQSYLVSVA